MTSAPPIPAWLAHRPVHAGVAVPWFVITLPDGTVDFAACEGRRVNTAMLEGRCGVCGLRIDVAPIVFFAGDDQLADLTLDALPMHPQCAAYSAQACPMVGGRLATYRSADTRAVRHPDCGRPGCDCGGYTVTDDRADRGQAAPRWYTVWCRDYTRVAPSAEILALVRAGRPTPDGERILARVDTPLRIRPVPTT